MSKVKIALVVLDSPKKVRRILSEFRKKFIVKGLQKALGITKEEAAEAMEDLKEKSFVIVNATEKGRAKLQRAHGFFTGLGINSKIVKEGKADKQVSEWLFDGITGENTAKKSDKKINKYSFLRHLNIEGMSNKEIANIIKAVSKKK
jgi:hypothetical protein